MKELIPIQTPKGKVNTYVSIQQHGKYGKQFIVVNNITVYSGKNIKGTYKRIVSGKFQFPKSFLRLMEKSIETNRKFNLPLRGKATHWTNANSNSILYYQLLGYNVKVICDLGNGKAVVSL